MDRLHTRLGASDLQVSRICLGCMGFGDPQAGQHSWTVGEDATRTIVKRALDAGVNFFDTAIAYQGGTSEQYVGRALRDFARREDVVVATKFLPRTADEIAEGVTGQQHIANSIDASLSHLGMDYVDLYIYHMWDYNTPLYDVMEGLAQVVAAGKVRYLGIANAYAWQLEKANALAEREGFPKFVSVQNHMNLIFREDEREMLPCCAEEGIALTPYSALASGRLSRHPGETSKRFEEDSYAKFKYDAAAGADARVIERVAKVADSRGVTMTEVSLAWLLTKVASPVVGATKPHHVDGAIGAVDLDLTDEEVAFLEEQYVPHAIVGVMAQNKPTDAGKEHIWLANAKYLKEAESASDQCATSINEYGHKVEDASEKSKDLGDVAKVALGNLAADAASKLADAAVDAAKAMVDVGSNFEAAMSEVEAISGASGSNLDAMPFLILGARGNMLLNM